MNNYDKLPSLMRYGLCDLLYKPTKSICVQRAYVIHSNGSSKYMTYDTYGPNHEPNSAKKQSQLHYPAIGAIYNEAVLDTIDAFCGNNYNHDDVLRIVGEFTAFLLKSSSTASIKIMSGMDEDIFHYLKNRFRVDFIAKLSDTSFVRSHLPDNKHIVKCHCIAISVEDYEKRTNTEVSELRGKPGEQVRYSAHYENGNQLITQRKTHWYQKDILEPCESCGETGNVVNMFERSYLLIKSDNLAVRQIAIKALRSANIPHEIIDIIINM